MMFFMIILCSEFFVLLVRLFLDFFIHGGCEFDVVHKLQFAEIPSKITARAN